MGVGGKGIWGRGGWGGGIGGGRGREGVRGRGEGRLFAKRLPCTGFSLVVQFDPIGSRSDSDGGLNRYRL